MRKSMSAIGAVALMGTIGVAPAYATEMTDTAALSVLHGVPDTPVDVYVNGELTLDDFAPGELAGPLELPAGDHELAITAADAADASEPVIGPVPVTLEAGGNYTATANLDAEGAPTANLFANDTSTIDAGQAKLTVRHVAAAPAVDVLAGGSPVIEGLTNPNEESLTLDAGTISAAVAAAGTTDPVLGPTELQLAEGTSTIVYAWGSLDDGNLALATQTIEGLHSTPGSVPGGQSGLAAADNDGALLAGSAAALVLAGAIAVTWRRTAAVKAGK
ncbi:MAG TPA: DUF4397 domain-containing protein [Arthrobacter sp.]|nr:DUF4397 domain-containing protein [Arthrobacter sp.]